MSHVKTAAAHRFGSHLSVAGGMHHAIEAALRLGMQAVQVFVKNQRQWRAAPLREDDVERWRELLATPGFGPAVAHATYLANLAAEDVELRERSCLALEEELKRCAQLGIAYLVFHPGAAGAQPAPVALRNVARSLDAIVAGAPPTVMPLLETTAGQGTALGRSFTELGGIIASMRHAERVGVCVDTCHVFAAGYDIRTVEGYAAMLAEAQQHVGLERIRCWHLNDSVGALGSRRDRHAHVGRGEIGAAGFRNVLADERFRGLPMILETPKGEDEGGREWDAINLRRLRAICRSIRPAAC